MLKRIKLVCIGISVLSVLPATVWLSGWQWQPGGNIPWLATLFAFTETVTRPWGTLTTVFLGLWLLWCLRSDLSGIKQRLQMAVVVVVVVWGGQGINTLIKQQVKEPRPYVRWLQEIPDSGAAGFYQLPAPERAVLIQRATSAEPLIPGWLRNHWRFESGYSFPSGHSMFAACWALLMLVYLWPAGHYKTVIMTFIWAIMVMWSRMALGMHWPRDVIMSIVVAGITVITVLRGVDLVRTCNRRIE